MNGTDHFQFARAFLRHAYDHHLIRGEEYVHLMRGVNQSEKEYFGCRTKDRFPTFNAAKTVIENKHIDRQSKLEIYPCPVCHGFHLRAHNDLRRRERLAAQQREADRAS